MTLVERKSRYEVILKIANKISQAVQQALADLKETAQDQFPLLFKTITSDNGLEFASLHDIFSEGTDIYFTHPFASWERGTSENQH